MSIRILIGDCRDVLRSLPAESVHCVVTSPPYWGLRDYGVAGQIGLEPTPDEYVGALVGVFREMRRVMRKDGTLWLNLGDSYAATTKGSGGIGKGTLNCGPALNAWSTEKQKLNGLRSFNLGDLKPKDLCGIPWRVAFALQADGWYLRQDIIWSKPNPMPESVRDRCTKAHEYIFLLSKSEKYFYDVEAIAEESIYAPDKTHEVERAKGYYLGKWKSPVNGSLRNDSSFKAIHNTRNKRSVWEVATSHYSEAHFATFPPALIEPCIKAGTSEKGCCGKCGAPWVRETEHIAGDNEANMRPKQTAGMSYSTSTLSLSGGSKEWAERGAKRYTIGWSPSCSCNAGAVPCTVLDPFGGAGTTGLVADRLGRNAILVELSPSYAAMADNRIRSEAGMFASVGVEPIEVLA